jgi:small subunit ribosomal protein S17
MTGADTQVQQTQTQRKTKVGRVVSDKMDKTIVVSVERLARHPLYKRVIRLTTKFKAHDETNDAHTGDTVIIEESRPLSATKRWRLIEVVARAGEHGSTSDMISEEAETSEAIHGSAHPGRTRDGGDGATDSEGTSAAPAVDASAEDASDSNAEGADDADDADRAEGGPA